MVKVKSIEETVENYVIGTIPGMFKTKRYWINQGYNEDHAISNAINYGIGQIKAGVSAGNFDLTIEIFRELAEIATAFANMLQKVKEGQVLNPALNRKESEGVPQSTSNIQQHI